MFKEDRICEANELLTNIERISNTFSIDIKTKVIKRLGSSNQIAQLRMQGMDIDELTKLFSDEKGREYWSTWNEGIGIREDIKVSTHKNEERGKYYFKLEGCIQSEIIHIIAALIENDLYTSWLPLCSKSQLISPSLSKTRNIVETEFDMVLLKKKSYLNT